MRLTFTESELTALRWSKRTNDEHEIGYLGPTVCKHGPEPLLARLVRDGLLECRTIRKPINGRTRFVHAESGYWITPAGRAALKDHPHDQ